MNIYEFAPKDIVRLRNRKQYETSRLDDGKFALFMINDIKADGVFLYDIEGLVPYDNIEPVSITDKDAKYVYFECVVAASMIDTFDQIPIRTIDKSYFMDAFMKVRSKDKTLYYDIVKHAKFDYVHEVQHWLRRNGDRSELRINDDYLLRGYFHRQNIPDAEKYMNLAIQVMNKSRQEKRGDEKISPLVGAVLVKTDGKVVTAYRSELREGDHAEYTLIERKCRDRRLDGAILFSTLEPCAPGARHYPKLSCSERIVNARIKKVYIGIEDPDPNVCRKGISYLQQHGIEVELFPQVLQDRITLANEKFLEQARKRARKIKTKQADITLSTKEAAVRDATFDELREDLLVQLLEKLGVRDNVHSGRALQVLMQMGLLEMENETLVPTGIGILLFGKNPQLRYPNAKIRATRILSNGNESIKTIDGPLVEQPQKLEDWFSMSISNEIDRSHADRRVIYSYPFEIIREIANNAILHRDYDIEGAVIQIVVSDDSITIKSPGEPVNPVRLEQLQNFSAPTLSRNPKLISVFDFWGLAEQRGLGFKTIRSLPEKYNMPLPVISWDAPYVVTTLLRIYKTSSELNAKEQEGYDYIRIIGLLGKMEYANRLGISVKMAERQLKHLTDIHLVERVGNGPSTKYKLISSNDSNDKENNKKK